ASTRTVDPGSIGSASRAGNTHATPMLIVTSGPASARVGSSSMYPLCHGLRASRPEKRRRWIALDPPGGRSDEHTPQRRIIIAGTGLHYYRTFGQKRASVP